MKRVTKEEGSLASRPQIIPCRDKASTPYHILLNRYGAGCFTNTVPLNCIIIVKKGICIPFYRFTDTNPFWVPGLNSNVRGGVPQCPKPSNSWKQQVSENSTQFWHYVLRHSIRFPRVRAQSCELAHYPPSTLFQIPVTSPGSYLCFSTGLQIRGSQTLFLGLQIPTASAGCSLYFGLTGYKAEVPRTSS